MEESPSAATCELYELVFVCSVSHWVVCGSMIGKEACGRTLSCPNDLTVQSVQLLCVCYGCAVDVGTDDAPVEAVSVSLRLLTVEFFLI